MVDSEHSYGFLTASDAAFLAYGSHELMLMTARDAKAAFGFSQKARVNVPIVHTLPGGWHIHDRRYQPILGYHSSLLVQLRIRLSSCKGCQAAVERGSEQVLSSAD